ncbi:hypothetical protein HanRHA438_Chr16g0775311 [Helianthus annuus]|nr:hypothetical protein HanRHA438_Chr16g0775311 [Helianthus annuus]
MKIRQNRVQFFPNFVLAEFVGLNCDLFLFFSLCFLISFDRIGDLSFLFARPITIIHEQTHTCGHIL